MREELYALHDNLTWTLVPCCPSMNVVSYRWIFQTKLNVDGSLTCHKARLITKGYHQQEGQDFDLTYALAVKEAIIHTILSIVATREW